MPLGRPRFRRRRRRHIESTRTESWVLAKLARFREKRASARRRIEALPDDQVAAVRRRHRREIVAWRCAWVIRGTAFLLGGLLALLFPPLLLFKFIPQVPAGSSGEMVRHIGLSSESGSGSDTEPDAWYSYRPIYDGESSYPSTTFFNINNINILSIVVFIQCNILLWYTGVFTEICNCVRVLCDKDIRTSIKTRGFRSGCFRCGLFPRLRYQVRGHLDAYSEYTADQSHWLDALADAAEARMHAQAARMHAGAVAVPAAAQLFIARESIDAAPLGVEHAEADIDKVAEAWWQSTLVDEGCRALDTHKRARCIETCCGCYCLYKSDRTRNTYRDGRTNNSGSDNESDCASSPPLIIEDMVLSDDSDNEIASGTRP
eukprot:SAG31_NODE_27_length_32731_cov_1443.130393_14_plen_375_part_00